MSTLRWVVVSCLGVTAACGGANDAAPTPDAGGVTPVDLPASCNPLGGVGCVTPWPSSAYEVAVASSPTGVNLVFPDGVLPRSAQGVTIESSRYNGRDGYSPTGFAFTVFPEGVDPSNLPSYVDPDASLAPGSPTVVLDLTTGERVAHFAEIDANALPFDPDRQALYVRPLQRLQSGHRYGVAIRSSLKARDGGPLARPAGFAALLEGRDDEHPLLPALRQRTIAAVEAFEAEGIPRDELVVAWDFTVASDAWITRTMLTARDGVLAAIGDDAANLSYTIIKDEFIEDDFHRLRGTFAAPLALDGLTDLPGMARDASGNVVVNGTMDAPFVALVPPCATANAPVPIILFGHGFFGSLAEAQGEHMRDVAQRLCAVVIATEWLGMRGDDLPIAARVLGDGSLLPAFSDRIAQGVLNFITLAAAARGPMAKTLLVDGTTSLVDPDRLYFYGISQGHVLGGAVTAYEPKLTRAVLQNGGAGWALLFERSSLWPTYHAILGGAYKGALNTVIMESLIQLALDPIESLNVAGQLTGDPLPGTQTKQILMQMALTDTEVTNLATTLHAREIGLPVLLPSVTVPWGLDTTAAPATSGLVIYDENPSPPPPTTNAAHSEANGTHRSMRRRGAALRQVVQFLDTGIIDATCDGACLCPTGACE